MRSLAISLALLTLVVPAAAQAAPAATLEIMQGRILLDQGRGFTPAAASQTVVAGNRIMVMSDSAAILTSTDTGCVLSLREPGEFVVPPLEDCVAGQAGVMTSSVKIIPANGIYQVLPPPPPPFVPPPITGLTPVLVGSSFVASIAGTFVFTQVVFPEKPISGY